MLINLWMRGHTSGNKSTFIINIQIRLWIPDVDLTNLIDWTLAGPLAKDILRRVGERLEKPLEAKQHRPFNYNGVFVAELTRCSIDRIRDQVWKSLSVWISIRIYTKGQTMSSGAKCYLIESFDELPKLGVYMVHYYGVIFFATWLKWVS